ncbi:PAS domain-containing protein [Sulfidibacter corallicola]|uniref:histidine kinase n=1 Tax=Sulfidibacter corallicola TaxID=2818388 RepID=A0A8A4TW41_SULCO|nr:ATP-binding protein [Sulfidibacter corallicola]QTD53388.1 PAS domain-containing protein [Sulfidibacter corallicola]
MRRRKLLWRIFSSFLIITLVALLLVSSFATTSFHRFHMRQTEAELRNSAVLVSARMADRESTENFLDLDRDFKQLRHQLAHRITIIREDGLVVADTDFDIARMDNHSDREEIREALAGQEAVSRRFSDTLQRKMLFVAEVSRLKDGSRVVVRVARSVTAIESTLRSIQVKIGMAWLVTAFLTAMIILFISRNISRPFEAFKSDAERMFLDGAESDYPSSQALEVEELADAMNVMLSQLHERSGTIAHQRSEVEAILSSMTEAVLAVDSEGRILKINQATADLFNLDLEACRGRRVSSRIRNQRLNQFAERILTGEQTGMAEFTLYTPEPKYLESHGAPLRDEAGNVLGAVIVINNVTRLKRLENVRSEFVANVSHELRTPVTAIKGFIETLQDGAVENVEDAYRFLEIIQRQTDRLNSIIEDLLSLSKIEQHSESVGLEYQRKSIRSVLEGAIRTCREKHHKNIPISLTCPEDCIAYFNPNLLEQAVVNLVDNAIKYSEENEGVYVCGYDNGDSIQIDVEDQGCGIPESHLPRLFERFYRVDKARSRDVGGTGLGLSIVKHIVQAHKGRVSVTSEVGSGSTFTMVIPKGALPAGEAQPTTEEVAG